MLFFVIRQQTLKKHFHVYITELHGTLEFWETPCKVEILVWKCSPGEDSEHGESLMTPVASGEVVKLWAQIMASCEQNVFIDLQKLPMVQCLRASDHPLVSRISR
jgi:hypothetical protein